MSKKPDSEKRFVLDIVTFGNERSRADHQAALQRLFSSEECAHLLTLMYQGIQSEGLPDTLKMEIFSIFAKIYAGLPTKFQDAVREWADDVEFREHVNPDLDLMRDELADAMTDKAAKKFEAPAQDILKRVMKGGFH